MLDEIVISRAIIDRYFNKLMDNLQIDVAIAGGGPAGLTAAYYLAKRKVRVAVYEKKLSIGGGMWGGGMMFNEIVVQEEAKKILDEMGIRSALYQKNYYTADSVEAISTLTSQAVKAGAVIFNCMSVEDVKLTQVPKHEFSFIVKEINIPHKGCIDPRCVLKIGVLKLRIGNFILPQV